MNPDLLTRYLALPIEARRLLAIVDPYAPGDWYSPDGCKYQFEDVDRPEDAAALVLYLLATGYLWLPADSATLMQAATPEGGSFRT